jgi:hypothetical protein
VTRLVVALVLVAIAVAVAVVLQRRKPQAPTQPTFAVPDRLDRLDFHRPDAEWLVAVFTSATCDGCAGVIDKALPLASDQVAVQEVEFSAGRDLHRRYGIDVVPLVAIADASGEVRGSFFGPVTAADLWATLAELREPGSVPEGCDGLGLCESGDEGRTVSPPDEPAGPGSAA